MRRTFDRLAAGYLESAQVQNEICERMLARLEFVRIDPAVILDAGAGPGMAARGIAARHPKASLIALDLSWQMLRQVPRAGKLARWLKASREPLIQTLCADFENLPLAPGSVDCIVSNLALSWSGDIPRAIGEMLRVLKPGGLFMFTTLGPDTLREFRPTPAHPAFRERLMDMHDLGDLLVQQGFSGPVMDQEQLRLTYSHPSKLLRDLKGWGGLDLTTGRRRGLGGKARLGVFAAPAHDKIQATLEVVYGHAWKPENRGPSRRLADGRSVIRFDRAVRK